MKKTIALILTLALCLGLLAACGGNNAPAAENTPAPAPTENTPAPAAEPTPAPAEPTPAPATPEPEPEPAEPDFVTWTELEYEVLGESRTYKLLPDGYNEIPSEHPMTWENVHYTTDVYGDGVTYDKFARVYLPYDYDPEDKDTKYNVLYFQHGNNGSPTELFDHDLKKLHCRTLLENLYDPDHGLMDPVIIVCPTYYFEATEDSYTTPGDSPAGDGRYEGIPALYHREVVEDLIPAIESRYNVYCTDFSEEGIKATRDHRAWAGYSRGSQCTWYMFHHDFEYFKYWMPMSAPVRMEGHTEAATVEEGVAYLLEPVEANPGLDFFLLASCGDAGDAERAAPMEAVLGGLDAASDLFSFGNDPAVNNIYFVRTPFNHNDLYMPYSLANFARILFK